jgi:hypothetical protein
MSRIKIFTLLLVTALFLGSYFVFLFKTNNSSDTSPAPKKVTGMYAYIDTIEKKDATYYFSVREVDFVTRPYCTDSPDQVTEALPACNPNGYLIRNERPVKVYTVRDPARVFYHASIAHDDGFTEEMATIPLDEFYKNFNYEEETIVTKRIFFRGKNENGLYQIRTQNDEILDVFGFYTP